MIYQIFSIIVSAIFLMFMFWLLWYVAVPLAAVAVVVSAALVLMKKIKFKVKSTQKRSRPIKANDIIDVDFKEINE